LFAFARAGVQSAGVRQMNNKTNNNKASAAADKTAQTGESNAPRVFNIETGLIGAGFFAKCGSVYTGGWSTERKAFNAARALLRKRNPLAQFEREAR
jgi:hypothetical protein